MSDGTAEATELEPNDPRTVRDLSKKFRTFHKYGTEAMDKKNYGYAVEMFRRVLKKQPACHEVRNKLREAQNLRVGGKPGALTGMWCWIVSSVIGVYNESVLLNKERYEEAMDLGEYCMTIDPTSSAAAKVLAKAAMDAEVFYAAVSALESAFKYHPKEVGLLADLADAYRHNGQGKKCLEMTQKLCSLQPNNRKWEDKRKEAAALASMEKDGWMDVEKGDGDYRTVMKDQSEAQLLEQEGRTQASDKGRVALIEDQLKKLESHDNVGNRRRLAELYANDKQWANAIEWYEKAQEIAEADDPAVAQKIVDLQCRQIDDEIAALSEQGADQARIEALRQKQVEIRRNGFVDTLKKFPNNHEVRFEYAQLLASQGEYDAALPEFQKVQANPRFKNEACMFIGQCFAAKGVWDLASDQFRVVIDNIYHMDETKKEAYFQLAQCLEQTGSPDEALKCYKEIYQVDVNFRNGVVRQKIEGGG